MRFDGYLSDIDFYSDRYDPSVTYAEVTVPPIGVNNSSYDMFVDIDDMKLKSYIRQIIIPNIGEKVSISDLLQDIKDVLVLGGNTDIVSPRVRTAGKLMKNVVEYDLNNVFHKYIQIIPTGWKITKKHSHKFLKSNTCGMQVTPQQTDKNLLTLLKPLVNTDRNGLILFATWIVQSFCVGNHSALLVMAEQGCGKTTLTKMARSIVDPSHRDVESMPSKKDELFTSLSNSYFVAFDNTDILNKDVSDILCAAITGATVAKRKLYTTNELGVYQLHNTLILNGIDIIPTESDLASRCLLLKLKPIDEIHRKTDSELMRLFESSLPEILGAIFNTLSSAMRIIHQIHPARLPRMAESYTEMLAIAISLGISETEFEQIYFNNLSAIDKERANIAVVEAVKEYMTSGEVIGRSVEGTVNNLFRKICTTYTGSIKDLPKSASHFSRKLKREQKALEAAGYTANFDDTYPDGTHLKIFKNK